MSTPVYTYMGIYSHSHTHIYIYTIYIFQYTTYYTYVSFRLPKVAVWDLQTQTNSQAARLSGSRAVAFQVLFPTGKDGNSNPSIHFSGKALWLFLGSYTAICLWMVEPKKNAWFVICIFFGSVFFQKLNWNLKAGGSRRVQADIIFSGIFNL